MHEKIVFKLMSGKTLAVSREDARMLARRLWDLAAEPGAAPLAVAITDALAASAPLSRPIEINERERAALDRVLGEPPSASR
ncbi:MAG: hypothetical protein KGL16_13275 [Acidobacteriota bacterium]|nr:hypothetical protein [Acidobacteriota bacterium]